MRMPGREAPNIRGSYTEVLTTIFPRPLSRNWVTGYLPRNTSNPISFITSGPLGSSQGWVSGSEMHGQRAINHIGPRSNGGIHARHIASGGAHSSLRIQELWTSGMSG